MSKNYFELLNLEIRYDINYNSLESNYINLQNQYHPDFFSSNLDKKLACDKIAKINEAYKTLLLPLTRAQYLLNMYDSNNLNSFESNEIAKKAMEIREKKTLAEIKEEIKNCINAIAISFDKKDYYQASKLTLLLKYLTKLIAE